MTAAVPLVGVLSFDNRRAMGSLRAGNGDCVTLAHTMAGGVRTMEYEFTFVVDGIAAEDDLAVGVIFDEFDGLLASHCGKQLLCVSGGGDNAVDAAHKLVVGLRRALPAVRLLRLDPDLVGVLDIAERTGRSRLDVLQWVNRESRKDRPFPQPEGMIGRSRVWRWGEVNAWLRAIGESGDELAPLRDETLEIDVMLPQWQQAVDDGLQRSSC